MTIVGARPQFVKAAPLSRALRRRVSEVLVHTGQHYDPEMSDAFFDQLGVPAPDLHLGVGSGSHGAMTGRMLEALESAMREVRPDWVLVLGDTNSTLAGALAAAKLGIPVAHVEAGLRSFDMRMPEEVNRRLTDHVSARLYCPTPEAVANLRREGIRRGVLRVGDVMMDAVVQNAKRAETLARLPDGLEPKAFCLATVHRQENTDDPARLASILEAFSRIPETVALPVHPRLRKRLVDEGLEPPANVRLLPPAPYLEMLLLTRHARLVLTDSGGLQKEAFILRTPCVTLRDQTEWVETVAAGANRIAGADAGRIGRAVRAAEKARPRWVAARFYGDGRASERVADNLARS
jgi:UDP-GlcNAc3NAcA epimerase